MNARVVALISLLLTASIGAGCTKTSLKGSQKNAPPFEPLVWLPTTTRSDERTLTPLEELRNAIEAFQNVKSFKSKLYVDNASGKTTAQIDVLKPSRFRGTIRVPTSNNGAEIIGVDSSLYLKPEGAPWVELSSPAMAKQLTETFRSAANGSGALIREALPDGTVVTKKRDNVHACDSFTTTLTSTKGPNIDLTICVANGLPSLLDIRAKDSHVSVTYTDYNSLFIIERPSVGK